MKILNSFCCTLIVALAVVSCSTDGDNGLSDKDSFTYKYEESNVPIKSCTAVRSENSFVITGSSENGQVFAIGFNKFGNLAQADSYSISDFDFPSSTSFEYYKSNYFNFELVGLDESKKRVSVKFSGNLYEDGYDLNSTDHYVEGDFTLGYLEVVPQLSGLEVSAKIGGEPWYSTDSDLSATGYSGGWIVSLNEFNDGEYMISYVIDPQNTVVGSYDFDENALVNKIDFFRYDPNTNEFIEYQTAGTFNITQKNDGFITHIIGEFNLTASNGSESIVITEGVINDVYSF